jgi:hypothetical protein
MGGASVVITVEELRVHVSSEGTDRVKRDFADLGSQAEKMPSAFSKVSTAMKGVGQNIGSTFSGVSGVLKNVGSVASGFVIGQGLMALPGLFSSIGQAGAAMELQQRKISTVFAEQEGAVRAWAAANAQAMGLTRNEATNLAAGLADLLVPMGMSREAAAQMATQTVGLAGALSEWSGGQKSAAEVSGILSAAFMGERDALNSLGISITQAEVDGRLLEKGQQALTGTAKQQAEALATQELIFAKSTDAQAAYAAGAGTAARQQAENTARMKEAKEQLAQGLVPAYAAVMSAAAAALPVAIQFGTQVAGSLRDVVNAVAPLAGDIFGPLVTGVQFLGQHREILAGVAATIATVMVPAVIAWTAAEVAKTTALIAGAAAFAVANAPLIALAAGIGVLVAGVVLLVRHWDDIVERFPIVGRAADEVVASFQHLVDVLGSVGRAIDAADIPGKLGAAFDFLKDLNLAEKFTSAFDFLRDIDLGQKIRDANWGAQIAAAVTEAFGSLRERGSELLAGLWEGVQAGWDGGTAFLTELGGKAVELVGDVTTTLLETGRSLITGLWDGTQQAWDGGTSFFIDLGLTVLGLIGDLGSDPPWRRQVAAHRLLEWRQSHLGGRAQFLDDARHRHPGSHRRAGQPAPAGGPGGADWPLERHQGGVEPGAGVLHRAGQYHPGSARQPGRALGAGRPRHDPGAHHWHREHGTARD